jgi:hypothetical protein
MGLEYSEVDDSGVTSMAVKDKVGDMELLLGIYVGGDIKNTTQYCDVA